MEGKNFSLMQSDALEQHRARQQGPSRDALSQPGKHGRVVKLHIHGLAGSAQSRNNSIYVSSSEATKLFAEFPTEGKFSSWLFSRTKGWAVPEKLFAQAEQEQQQAANPFPAWTRAMEAEEQPISPCRCIAGNLQGSVTTFFSCCLLSHYKEHQC